MKKRKKKELRKLVNKIPVIFLVKKDICDYSNHTMGRSRYLLT